MAQQVWIKTLTRRHTRVNDPLPSQAGLGAAGVTGQGTAQYYGNYVSRAGQSVAGVNNQIALVDLEDGPTSRIFANKSTTTVVLPDIVADFQISGLAVVGSANSGLVWRVPRAMNIWGVAVQAGSAPIGGTVLFDVVSVANPTATLGTSIFVDAGRIPQLGSSTPTQDYSLLGNNVTTYYGLPGGSAVMNASPVQNVNPFQGGVGKGNTGAAVGFGSALGLGTVTPNNTFNVASGYLRVNVGTADGSTTNMGGNYTIQIFGF